MTLSLCTKCQVGQDFTDSALDYCDRHKQEHQSYHGYRIVTSCTGFKQKEQQTITIDEKQQPAKVAV